MWKVAAPAWPGRTMAFFGLDGRKGGREEGRKGGREEVK
jgi:hypothetical protein